MWKRRRREPYSGRVEIVAPLAQDLGDEFGITLCDDHRGLSVIGFVHVLPEHVFEGVL